MKISNPSRILVIGSSHTGKTFLVAKMFMRLDFGNPRNIQINVVSPTQQSLNQPLWNGLENEGFMINKSVYTNFAKPNFRPDPDRQIVWVIDDLDNIRSGPNNWISKLFTTESHHDNCTVIMISHKLNAGCPEARDSAEYVILTAASDVMLDRTMNGLGMRRDEKAVVINQLRNPAGFVADDTGCLRCFNHVLVMEKMLFDPLTLNRMPKFYEIPQAGVIREI